MRSWARAPWRGSSAGGAAGSRAAFRFRDWALALVVALAHLAPVRTGQDDSSLGPLWLQSIVPLLALGSGLALLWRQTRPRAVAVCVLTCYAGLGLIEGPVPPYAAWVLIWSIATGGTDRHRSVVLTWVTAALTSALLVLAELARPGVGALAFLVVVTMLVTLAAVLVRTERGRVEAVGRRATTEERLRIARDLHDLVGHGLSAIAVQSSTARVALQAGDPVTASKALAAVEATSRVAMREMRQMLGVLVDPGVDAAGEAASAGPDTAQPDPSAQPPSPGLDDIPALVDNVRAGGVAVSLSRTGPWEAASPAVQVCAYRLVQEGLTNAVKHAPGALVTVRLEATGADWRIEVRTAGAVTASNGRSSGGRGLDGLRARVTALSGDFASGPTQHGWLLEARLPVEGAS